MSAACGTERNGILLACAQAAEQFVLGCSYLSGVSCACLCLGYPTGMRGCNAIVSPCVSLCRHQRRCFLVALDQPYSSSRLVIHPCISSAAVAAAALARSAAACLIARICSTHHLSISRRSLQYENRTCKYENGCGAVLCVQCRKCFHGSKCPC